MIQGLVSKPELNGAACKKLGMDTSTGRWIVELPDGTQMKLKPSSVIMVRDWTDDNERSATYGQAITCQMMNM